MDMRFGTLTYMNYERLFAHNGSLRHREKPHAGFRRNFDLNTNSLWLDTVSLFATLNNSSNKNRIGNCLTPKWKTQSERDSLVMSIYSCCFSFRCLWLRSMKQKREYTKRIGMNPATYWMNVSASWFSLGYDFHPFAVQKFDFNSNLLSLCV